MKTRRPVLCLFVVALVALLYASPASAQKAPRLQLFAGYSYMRFDSTTIGFPDYANLHGFDLSGAFNISRNFGIVADGGAHFGDHQRVYEYLLGPQFLGQRGRKIVFFHALFGKANDHVSVNGVNTASGRAIGVGAGFDYYMSPRYSIRVVQADYLDTHIFNVSQGNLRVSTGIVFHWGRAK